MSDYLVHHGILGQKWGVQNGPPYPLGSEDHSKREKRSGWRASLRKKESNVDSGKRVSKSSNNPNKVKLNIQAAAVLTTGLLATAGAYYLIKSGAAKDLIKSGKSLVNSILSGVGDTSSLEVIRSLKQDNLGNTKLSTAKIKMISNINSRYRNGNVLEPGGTNNCMHCSTAYILNSLFGYNVTAAPTNEFHGNIDEVSGLFMNRDEKLPLRIFDGIKYSDYSFDGVKENTAFETNRREKMRPTFLEAFSKIQNGSTGMVAIKGHIMNYEKDKNGNVLIIDPQSNIIEKIENMSNRLKVYGIYDFSNASIREDASDILKLLVS